MAYMDKERAESNTRHKGYLDWLKGAQAGSREQHKKFVTSHREYEKTLGKL